MAELIWRYTVFGDPRTKKNSQMIAGSGARCPKCGKPAKQWIRQGAAYNDYAESAAWQLRPVPKKPIDRPVNVRYLFYMKTRRKVDLVNLEEAMDDILVSRGILADDNAAIIAGHDGSRVLYDKKNPRVEIEITEFRADVGIGPYEMVTKSHRYRRRHHEPGTEKGAGAEEGAGDELCRPAGAAEDRTADPADGDGGPGRGAGRGHQVPADALGRGDRAQ